MAEEQNGKSTNKWHTYEVVCGMILFIAVIISMSEIVLRVGFNTSYDFIIQASVWLTVWALLLIGGPVLAEDGHVSIDFLITRLRGKPRWVLMFFNTITTLIYSIAITYGGVLLVIELIKKGSVFPMYLPVPMWTIQIIVPISMAVFTYFSAVRFYQVLTGSK